MILPASRLLWILAALLAAALAASIYGAQDLWFAAAAVVAAAALVDALMALRLPAPELARRVPHALALGVRTEVSLRILNPAKRRIRLEIQDHHPASLEAEGLPRAVALAAGGWTELRYQVRAIARGEARFGRAEARLASPLALWQVTRRAGEEAPVRVYPNFQALARYTLLATDNRLSQIGVLQVRRRGEGTEFHQLREYRQGDPQRAIDWKATARTGRLIAREYEVRTRTSACSW
jgi:uncharacterized protein (DUF58 family)